MNLAKFEYRLKKILSHKSSTSVTQYVIELHFSQNLKNLNAILINDEDIEICQRVFF